MSNNDNLKRLNILLRTISKINQQLVISNDEKKLCQKICGHLVKIKGYKFVWIGLKEVGNGKLAPVALAGKDKEFVRLIKNSWNKYGFTNCPASIALKSGRHFLNEDLENAERFVPWDKRAMEKGFLSTLVLPIKYHSDVVGTLHIYSDMKNYFLEEEVSFLKEVTGDISIGIKSIRDERKLTESKKEYEELFKRISSCVAIYKPKDNGNDFIIKDFNYAAENAEKIKREDIIGKSVLKVFPGVKDLGLFDVFKRVYKTGKPENHPESIYKDKRISGWRENFIYKLPNGDVVAVYNDLTEKKKAEEEIIRANERLALAQKSAGAGVWDWDLNTEKLNWSPEFYILFGLDPKKDTAAFDTWRRILHPEDRQGAEEKINESIKERKPLFNEYRIIKPSGEVLWINALGNTTYDEHGKAIRMSGICIDITERKRMEESLRASEEKFAKAFYSSPQGLTITTLDDDKIIEVNNTYMDIFGYSREEVIGHTSLKLSNWVNPKDRAMLVNILKEKGFVRNKEVEVRTKSGNIITLLLSAELLDVEGKICMLSTFYNITDRKKAEEALHESEEKYRTLFDTSKEGILITEFETLKFKYANPAICQILGYTEKELTAMGIADIHPKGALQDILAIFQNKIIPHTTETQCLRKDGTIIRAEITESIITIGGKKYGAGFCRDITKRKLAEDLLRIEHERLANILEGTNVGTWEWNVATGETVFNERWANIIGYTLDEISPVSIETWERFAHPGDLIKSNEKLSKVFARELDYYDIDCRMKHKDGNWVWVQDRGKVISWTPDGKPLWMSGTHTDITNRKKAEEDLIQNENLLNQVGEISKIGGWEMDVARGGKAKWTKCTYDIVEISHNDPIPGYDEHINYYLPKYRKMIRKKMQKLMIKKEALHFQAQAKTAKNNIIWVEAFGEAITEDGKAVKLIGTLQNITERKKAEEDLKISLEKTKKILEETIKTLSAIVEIRDPYTSGHQQKVAQIATSIAIEMGLGQDIVNGISTAAIIHDIGKIIIPASILSKPGKISELEYKMIKTHPETGYNMLKNIDFHWPVANIVLQHHERINGTGYPQNLEGRNILLEAKILAVADVLEAMNSHRPYRPSLGLDQAIKELEDNKGILYDPEIVDICRKLIKSGVIDFYTV
jgi:PAS domain S-box-containing protein/putative nucleotidyltransferase with HDIG domain